MLSRSKTLYSTCRLGCLQYQRWCMPKSKPLRCTILMSRLHTSEFTFALQTSTKNDDTSENIRPVNKFVNRTHTCGELDVKNIGQSVHLCGWLEFQRMGKFFVLRDAYGSTQCIIDEKNTELSNKVQDLSIESVLRVTGNVVPRPKDQCNPNMKTGSIEIQVESVDILNTSMPQLPFYIRNYNKAKEALQMEYRYLALRFPELQRNLRVRSWVIMKMREYLVNECGFVDIATPTLFRRTPGGAQEFIVPTRQAGKFYSLVQSPQQFKQLLMVGGFDRYFQLAQCYRDEGSRNDRQPEFTQLDIEMSFVERKDVMSMIEELIIYSWPKFLGSLETPFQHLSYEEAMESYGTDAPDLRIPGKIYNLSSVIKNNESNFNECVYASVFSGKQEYLTKSVKEKLIAVSKQVFQKASLIQLKVLDPLDFNLSGLNKLLSEDTRKNIVKHLNLKKDDLLLLTYGPKSDARQLLGKIRVELTNILEQKGNTIRNSGYKFAWIYDFPLFAKDNDTNTLETTHHPFTQPHPDDVQYLFTEPLKVRGLQYDLVLNGSEIGGGSIRIHTKKFQEQILKMLNIDSSEMYYLLEALNSGAPPHGGIALGLDRYISMLCDTTSIRDVIAFPKTMEGRDLMSGAPALISEEDKKLYHIDICDQDKKS